MPAPTSNVRGTLKDATGTVRSGAVVSFMPLDTPRVSGGDLVVSETIQVTLSAGGQFGYSGNTPFPFVLTQGNYRVIVSDRDAFTIAVPGDGGTHDIGTLAVALDSQTTLNSSSVSPSGLVETLVSSPSVNVHQGEPLVGVYHRVVFVGESESGSSTVMGKLATLIEAMGPTDVVGINLNAGGLAGSIDDNIGQWFHSYIEDYSGSYGFAASVNHFWYCLGAADWIPGNVTAVTNFLKLPGNERYYSVVLEDGNTTLFVLDSNAAEPDGNSTSSAQYTWFIAALAASTTTWNIVVFRDALLASSSPNLSTPAMNWNWASLNVHAIICGGKQFYERIMLTATLPLFVCGGAFNFGSPDSFGTPVTGSAVRYNAAAGLLKLDAFEGKLIFEYVTNLGEIEDFFSITAPLSSQVVAEIRAGVSSGIFIEPTLGSVSVDRGLGPAQVPPSNYYTFLEGKEGRLLHLTALPDVEDVRQVPWLKNCMIVLGEDPPSLWYWHKNQFAWKRWSLPEQGNTTYVPGGMPQLAAVTFSIPVFLGTNAASAYAVTLTHGTAGAIIYFAIDDGEFFQITDPYFRVFIPADRKAHTVSAYATKAGFRDSEILSYPYIASSDIDIPV